MTAKTIVRTSATARPTVASLQEVVQAQATEAVQMRESLADLQLAIEDRGWFSVGNSYEATGLDLASLKIVSDALRPWLVAGSIIKRIAELRGNVIYGSGVGFANFDKAKAPFASANNRAKLFSATALREINRGHCTDGTIVFLVHKVTKEITRYAVDQMGAPFVDSNDRESIWFVRRSYNHRTAGDPQGHFVDEYYATDTCPPDENVGEYIVEELGHQTPINKNYTAVVWRVNGQVGWPLGIPDLLPALQWAEKYTDYLKDQAKFAKALAQIAWRLKAQTSDQLAKLASVVRPDGVADTMGLTNGMDMTPMVGNSDVSFTNGAALAAAAASAGEVTVEDVLAERDSTAAGSTLDPTVLDMAGARRSDATDIFKRIGKLLGAPNLEVIWPNLQDESPFREAQMIIAAWATGNFWPDEIRSSVAQRLRIDLSKEVGPQPLVPGTKAAITAATPPPPPPAVAPDPAAASSDLNNSQGKDSLGVGKVSAGDHTARDRGELPKP